MKGNRAHCVNRLREQILSGKWREGQRISSTREIAKDFDISLQTAHFALKELVAEGLIESRQRSGNYVAPRDGSQLPKKVALVMEMGDSFMQNVAANFIRQFQNHNLLPLVVDIHSQPLEELFKQISFKRMLREKPDVIIYSQVFLDRLPPTAAKIPSICLSNFDETQDLSASHLVCPNYVRAGYLATQHLIRSKRKHIACYCIDSYDKKRYGRLSGMNKLFYMGYRRALEEADLEERLITCPTLRSGKNRILNAFEEPKSRPDAFVSPQDHRSVELLDTLEELQLRVPKDVAIVSALNTEWAPAKGLSSIDYQYDKIASECIRLITSREKPLLNKQAKINLLVEPRLVKRSSAP